MINHHHLLEGIRNTPVDARVDHHTPLEDRGPSATALLATQITGEDGTWAEREAVALTLGIAAHQKELDPTQGKLCIGALARRIDRVSDFGVGGAALKRLQHIIRAVHDHKPLTIRRYLVEFGKLQTNDARLDLAQLAAQATCLFGSDRGRAREVIHHWQITYRRGVT